jgi:hypothetical protein
LPAFLKETTALGFERVRPDARGDLPEVVFVDSSGRIGSEGAGVEAALMRRNFLFCLNPDCGVAYTKSQRSERGKLNTLGVDNRSTATTILAVRALIELQSDANLKPEARKLLSFTDNRQDASLQAGHFNDFAQVMLLRSALHQALQAQKDAGGLSHGDLSRRVFEALALPFEEYATNPDLRGPSRTLTHDALRQVIDYYLYRDLQRGWRLTVPNLEDCGLLVFDCVGLTGSDGLLADAPLWETGFNVQVDRHTTQCVAPPPALHASPPVVREEVIRTLLDVLRRGLAVKVDVLDYEKQRDLVERTQPHLREDTVWYLDDTRELVKSVVAFPRRGQREDKSGLFVSSQGSYGRYLRRCLKPYAPPDQHFGLDEVDAAIRFLFLALRCFGILERVRGGEPPAARPNAGRNARATPVEPVPGYQINPGSLRWLPGPGEVRPIDRTRLLEAGEIPPEVNRYFVECYRHFVDLKCALEAREHTAQVAPDDRQDREQRFREGDLPLLFCSPTMELGVDIAQLNLVNLRNVPPTPANYAQRSGRAGRGGQPALVYTYCAGRSPHDQYYYHRPRQMVGGVVAPPRIDLRNRDLIRSHPHALWMEVAQPDFGMTLTAVLDMEPRAGQLPLPVREGLRALLADPMHRAAALAKARIILDGLQDLLSTASWFHPQWAKDTCDRLERAFDESCDRWRDLYRAAVRQRELHHRIIGDHSRSEAERQFSKRLRAQAEAQIKLLAEVEGLYQGDFYSYRYFATEGFLPGYNFPRLPISARARGAGLPAGRGEGLLVAQSGRRPGSG